jgi:hypothetical protein
MRKKLAKENGLPDLVHPGAPTFELRENHVRGKQEPERYHRLPLGLRPISGCKSRQSA